MTPCHVRGRLNRAVNIKSSTQICKSKNQQSCLWMHRKTVATHSAQLIQITQKTSSRRWTWTSSSISLATTSSITLPCDLMRTRVVCARVESDWFIRKRGKLSKTHGWLSSTTTTSTVRAFSSRSACRFKLTKFYNHEEFKFYFYL